MLQAENIVKRTEYVNEENTLPTWRKDKGPEDGNNETIKTNDSRLKEKDKEKCLYKENKDGQMKNKKTLQSTEESRTQIDKEETLIIKEVKMIKTRKEEKNEEDQ